MIPRSTRMFFPAPASPIKVRGEQPAMNRSRRVDFSEYQTASPAVQANSRSDPTDVPYTRVRRIVRETSQVSDLGSAPVPVASSPVRAPIRAPIVFSSTHVKVPVGKRTLACPKAYRDSLLPVAPSEELPPFIPFRGKWRPACPPTSPKSPTIARGSKVPLDFLSRIPKPSATPRCNGVVAASTRGMFSPSSLRAGPPSSSMSLAPFSPRKGGELPTPTRFGAKGAGLVIVPAKRGGMNDWKSFPLSSSWMNITRAQAKVAAPSSGDVPQQSALVSGVSPLPVPSEKAEEVEHCPAQEKEEEALASEPLPSAGEGVAGDSAEEPAAPLPKEEEAKSEVSTSTEDSSVVSEMTISTVSSSTSDLSSSWNEERIARRREKILALEERIARRKEMRRGVVKGKMEPLFDSQGRFIIKSCEHASCRTEGHCTYKYRDEVLAMPKRLAIELEETLGKDWRTTFGLEGGFAR